MGATGIGEIRQPPTFRAGEEMLELVQEAGEAQGQQAVS